MICRPKPKMIGSGSSAVPRRLRKRPTPLMIPERAIDPEWPRYAKALADAAEKAYQAAEARDLKTISQVSDQLDGICAACHRHYGVE